MNRKTLKRSTTLTLLFSTIPIVVAQRSSMSLLSGDDPFTYIITTVVDFFLRLASLRVTLPVTGEQATYLAVFITWVILSIIFFLGAGRIPLFKDGGYGESSHKRPRILFAFSVALLVTFTSSISAYITFALENWLNPVFSYALALGLIVMIVSITKFGVRGVTGGKSWIKSSEGGGGRRSSGRERDFGWPGRKWHDLKNGFKRGKDAENKEKTEIKDAENENIQSKEEENKVKEIETDLIREKKELGAIKMFLEDILKKLNYLAIEAERTPEDPRILQQLHEIMNELKRVYNITHQAENMDHHLLNEIQKLKKINLKMLKEFTFDKRINTKIRKDVAQEKHIMEIEGNENKELAIGEQVRQYQNTAIKEAEKIEKVIIDLESSQETFAKHVKEMEKIEKEIKKYVEESEKLEESGKDIRSYIKGIQYLVKELLGSVNLQGTHAKESLYVIEDANKLIENEYHIVRLILKDELQAEKLLHFDEVEEKRMIEKVPR